MNYTVITRVALLASLQHDNGKLRLHQLLDAALHVVVVFLASGRAEASEIVMTHG